MMNAELALDILKTLFLFVCAAAAYRGTRQLEGVPKLAESFVRLEATAVRLLALIQTTKVHAEGAEVVASEVRAIQREELRVARASRPSVGDTGRWQAVQECAGPSSADAARGLGDRISRDSLPSSP
jgi:hypothetical protein